MSNVFQHQYQAMPTAYDMMLSLKEIFRDQNRAARLVTMKDLVRDHVLKMISLLNELEILKFDIDGKTQVNIILQSLSDSFNQLCLNYNMNKFSYSLVELQATERLIKKPTVTLVFEKGSNSKLKGKKKQKKVQK